MQRRGRKGSVAKHSLASRLLTFTQLSAAGLTHWPVRLLASETVELGCGAVILPETTRQALKRRTQARAPHMSSGASHQQESAAAMEEILDLDLYTQPL